MRGSCAWRSLSAYRTPRPTVQGALLSLEEMRKTHTGACNYLALGMIGRVLGVWASLPAAGVRGNE